MTEVFTLLSLLECLAWTSKSDRPFKTKTVLYTFWECLKSHCFFAFIPGGWLFETFMFTIYVYFIIAWAGRVIDLTSLKYSTLHIRKKKKSHRPSRISSWYSARAGINKKWNLLITLTTMSKTIVNFFISRVQAVVIWPEFIISLMFTSFLF